MVCAVKEKVSRKIVVALPVFLWCRKSSLRCVNYKNTNMVLNSRTKIFKTTHYEIITIFFRKREELWKRQFMDWESILKIILLKPSLSYKLFAEWNTFMYSAEKYMVESNLIPTVWVIFIRELRFLRLQIYNDFKFQGILVRTALR